MFTVNTLRIENNKLFGTIKHNCTDVRIVFDGLHKEDLALMFEYEFVNSDITFDENVVLKEGDHIIYIPKGITRKMLVKALVEIFSYAFAKADEE